MGVAEAGIAISVGGTLLKLLGEGQESHRTRTEALENKRQAYLAATDAEARGRQEAGGLRTQATQLLAKQRVAYANSGVDSTVGTPANVQAATAGVAELDARTIENNAAREAWGFRQEGEKFQRAANAESARAPLRAAGTVLGGVGQAASYGSPRPRGKR
jgi:hypothetical protein